MLDRLDRIRRRRHQIVYDTAGQTSEAEVQEALLLAWQLVPLLKAAALAELERRRRS
ncbi:MAG TPA: hypothetical protein VNL77_17495 [Roseiflexaceae bacterium]|nr:hypothetical protein [Roseiflexaceae bacterium]